MSKVFVILAAVQLVLLGFIATKLISLEQAVENAALIGPQIAQRVTATAGHEAQDAAVPGPHDWESSLRRVIREEIGSFEQLRGIETGSVVRGSGSGANSPPHDPARVAAVNRQLDYFISIGQISPAEMSALQREIAGLDEDARRQILGKLTGAMNRGALKGQL